MPLFGDSIDLLNALLAAVLSRSHLLVAHLGARAIRRQTTLQAARVSMRLFGDAPNIPVETSPSSCDNDNKRQTIVGRDEGFLA